ncbi:DUF4426 domain-containing protein [Montanilutibacter psychrotolerans]|nr:DUF4426 domain-containing protein [Lysobacter psychrotolerans]
MPTASSARLIRRWTTTAAVLFAVALAGCGREASTPSDSADQAAALREEAVLQAGDATVRASVIPTTNVGAAIATQYGIARSEDSVLLMVGVRQGPQATETSLPATVVASVRDLRGVRQAIAMREVRSGDSIDYVGTATVAAPDTLRFDILVQRQGKPEARLQFSRDIFPR